MRRISNHEARAGATSLRGAKATKQSILFLRPRRIASLALGISGSVSAVLFLFGGSRLRLIQPTNHQTGATPCARRAEFVEADQADLGCPVPFAKIFLSPFYPNQIYNPRHPVPHEGRIAIVTDVGHGVRWTRLVLLTNGADADGEVVWF